MSQTASRTSFRRKILSGPTPIFSPRRPWAIRLLLLGLALSGIPLAAQAELTVTPLTWNIIGLDSNNPALGPRDFPIGARVCSDIDTGNVSVDLVWESSNPNVDIRPGSLDSLIIDSIAANTCADAYYEVEVNPIVAAFDTTRRYRIDATDAGGTASSPTPREVYVEHLISQNRNAITGVRVGATPADLAPVPPGGAMNLVVGNTYVIELSGGTATQGYEQFEAFINFPNTIFQILAVNTTYSADTTPFVDSPNDKLYGDACRWENDPSGPLYRACRASGKIGGSDVVTTYTIHILGGGGSAQTLNTLLYDFSGSSFHYNADFGIGARIANIIDPSNAGIAKSFTPATIPAGGAATLKITLTNPNAGALSGYNFSDTLPAGMTVATPPNATTSNCGTPSFAPSAGASALSFTDGTVAANSSCTVSVSVTTAGTGSFVNTTDNLFIDNADTGNSATATLTVGSAPPPPAAMCGIPLASWRFPSGFSIAAPAPSTGTGSASPGVGITANAQTTLTVDGTDAWGSNGGIATGATLATTNNDYFDFAVDTTGLSGVELAFKAQHRSANGPQGIAVYVGSDPGNPETGTAIFSSDTGVSTTAATFGPLSATSQINTSGTTHFRIYFFNAGNTIPGADAVLDDVVFVGCGTPLQPTIAKAFAPATIAAGAVSTLTFTLSNPNSVALTGANFSDDLPAGMSVNAAGFVSNGCGFSGAPVLSATSLNLTGGTIPASGSCTVQVSVTTSQPGPSTNISGFLATTQTGTNAGVGGSAVATLTTIAPPVIAKQFSPNPILANGSARLQFTVTNPNSNAAISGVVFSDVLPAVPAQMRVATPANATFSPECGAPTFTPAAGATSISFAGGGIPSGSTCVASVDITVPQEGSYLNTSSNVTHVVNGQTVAGNATSDTLDAVPSSPGIALLKQVGASATGPWFPFLPVNLPGAVFYRFTLENLGDVALTPITLSDPLIDVSTCTLPASLPVADALDDDHIFICVVGPVDATAGTVVNTAEAGGTFAGDIYTDQGSATYANTGLTLAKTADRATFAGEDETINYSFTVTNNGAAILDGPVSIDDPLIAAASCPALTTVGNLDNFFNPSEVIVCTGSYTTTTSDLDSGSVQNTATATTPGLRSAPSTATVIYVDSAADLGILKDVSDTTPLVGADVVFTLTVTNNGPSDAVGVAVSDPLPSGYTYQSDNGGGAYNSTSGIWTIGNLANAASVSLEITAAVNGTGIYANTAQVTGTMTDPNPDNDSATATPVPFVPAPALTITKTQTSGPDPAVADDVLGYTILIANTGNVSQTGVTVTDTLPDGSAGSLSGPVESITSNSVLEVAETWTYTISYTVSAADVTAGADLVNSASVVTTQLPGPTVDTATTGVSAPDLRVDKSHTGVFTQGQSGAQYSLVVSNAGPAPSNGLVTVTDTLPAGLAATAIAGTGWTCTLASKSCTRSDVLAASASYPAIILTVDVAVDAATDLTNTATVSGGGDGDLTNNSDTDPARVSATLTQPVPINSAGALALLMLLLLLAARHTGKRRVF